MRENIQGFITIYVQQKLTPLDKVTKDPVSFVNLLNEIWSNYQLFVLSYTHVADKLTDFYAGFYKMNNIKDY